MNYGDYGLVVVDGNSADDTVRICKKLGVKCIQGDFTRSKAYNYACKHFDADYYAFVDADCVVPKNWLGTLLQEMNDKDGAVAGGFYRTPEDTGRWAKLVGFELDTRRNRFRGVMRRLPSGCLLIKREILEKFPFHNGYDTAQETDWGYRITQLGYKIIYVPKADVLHYHRNGVASFFKQQYRYGKGIVDFYLNNRTAIKGDEITSFWMNIQPVLFLTGVLIPTLLVYWILLSIAKYFETRNKLALGLFAVYFVRCLAWSTGLVRWAIEKLLRK